jgi:hypothetical protein
VVRSHPIPDIHLHKGREQDRDNEQHRAKIQDKVLKRIEQTLEKRDDNDFPEILVNTDGQDIALNLILGLLDQPRRGNIFIDHQHHQRHENTQKQYPPELIDKPKGIQ